MNYKRLYNSIVTNARLQERDCYTETHHIVPRSLGGADTEDNLVILTAREHFIAHWLLSKFTVGPNKGKMIKALSLMRSEGKYQKRYTTKITARVYENLREEHARIISEQNTGRVQPQHEKENQITAMTGRKRPAFSKERRENLSKAHSGEGNGMYGKTQSASAKKIMSEKAKGRKQSAETIAKKADAVRGSKREKQLCPHCDRAVAVNGYARWHGDNCKEKSFFVD